MALLSLFFTRFQTTREQVMRRLVLDVTVVVLVLFGLGAGGSDANARVRSRYAPAPLVQDRYCLQGRIWGYPGNCEFSNYYQCMASASGTDAYCGENPIYLFRRQPWPE